MLLSWHGIRSSTQWDEAYGLFHKFHADEPDYAVLTAALLCTDHRWRKASHHLIVRIVDSGVLGDADVQQLAEWFAIPDGFQVDTEMPDDVDTEVELEAGGPDVDHPQDAGEEPRMVTLKRSIWPPLRRWAAARLVVHDPSRWRSLLDAADAMASRDGAAVAAGVMDAAPHIRLQERSEAVEAGLRSGSGIGSTRRTASVRRSRRNRRRRGPCRCRSVGQGPCLDADGITRPTAEAPDGTRQGRGPAHTRDHRPGQPVLTRPDAGSLRRADGRRSGWRHSYALPSQRR